MREFHFYQNMNDLKCFMIKLSPHRYNASLLTLNKFIKSRWEIEFIVIFSLLFEIGKKELNSVLNTYDKTNRAYVIKLYTVKYYYYY